MTIASLLLLASNCSRNLKERVGGHILIPAVHQVSALSFTPAPKPSSFSNNNHSDNNNNGNQNINNTLKKSKIKPTPCTRICRYNANFYDGQVCIGCFRDTVEISTWSQMSHEEKGYTLLDAHDRCISQCIDSQGEEQHKLQFEASISKEELQEQAQAWFGLSKNGDGRIGSSVSMGITSIGGGGLIQSSTRTNDEKQYQKENYNNDNYKSDEAVTPFSPVNVISTTTISSTNNKESSLNQVEKVSSSSNKIQDTIDELKIPPSCSYDNKNYNNDNDRNSKVCQFDNNFCNGQVCKTCFRDEFEVQNWGSFDVNEKIIALHDVADRLRQYQKNGDNHDDYDNQNNHNNHDKEKKIDTDKINIVKGGHTKPDHDNDIRINNDGKDKKDKGDSDDQTINCNQWEEIDIETKQRRKINSNNSNNRINISNMKNMDNSNDNKNSLRFDKFLEGDSVILLPSLIDENICNDIIKSVSKAAKDYHADRRRSDLPDEGIARLPTIDAAKRAKKNNTPCAQPIDSMSDAMLQNVLRKVFNTLDSSLELSHLVSELFDNMGDNDGHDNKHDGHNGIAVSISQLYELDQLVYSSREPAINVYTKGGKFLAHEDDQRLTILIPISSPDDFCGGGTAFWCQESRGHRVDPPSLILKPERGTVILFGGHVTHAGLPVESGERIVFVASFSRRRN